MGGCKLACHFMCCWTLKLNIFHHCMYLKHELQTAYHTEFLHACSCAPQEMFCVSKLSCGTVSFTKTKGTNTEELCRGSRRRVWAHETHQTSPLMFYIFPHSVRATGSQPHRPLVLHSVHWVQNSNDMDFEAATSRSNRQFRSSIVYC